MGLPGKSFTWNWTEEALNVQRRFTKLISGPYQEALREDGRPADLVLSDSSADWLDGEAEDNNSGDFDFLDKIYLEAYHK